MTNTGKRIRKVRNILYHRTAVSLLSIFATCVAIFLMTGALYFRNEVIITDSGNTYRIFTMHSEPGLILAEQGFKLTGLDYYSFESVERGKAALTINRSFPIMIRADGEVIQTEAFEGETVGEIISRYGITLGERDLISPALYRRMSEVSGDVIRITRAFDITIHIYGETVELPVTPDGRTTVSDVLRREGIRLGDEAIAGKSLSSLAYPGFETEISIVTYVNRTVIAEIPYETYTRTSNLKVIGEREVLTAGVAGSERIVIIDTVVDGYVVDSEVISVELLSEPVTEVVMTGLALAEPYSRRDFTEIELVNGRPANYEYKISGRASAYTAGPTARTASGRTLEIGTVAVDPRKIPYGSLLYIVSQCGGIVYGAAVAADTGSFIYTTDIVVDVFKGLTSENYSLAMEWGLKHVDVYIINTGIY
jgi:uncharacterized protein YabE (DUF348 family)/3D (Asp-Asp-Asp) domain-containing protein